MPDDDDGAEQASNGTGGSWSRRRRRVGLSKPKGRSSAQRRRGGLRRRQFRWPESRAIAYLTHKVTRRDLRVPISSMRAQISESIGLIASGGRVQKLILGKNFSRLSRLSKTELDCTGQSQIAPQSTRCRRYLDLSPQLSPPKSLVPSLCVFFHSFPPQIFADISKSSLPHRILPLIG